MLNLMRPDIHFADTSQKQQTSGVVGAAEFLYVIKVTKAQNSSFTCKCKRK